MCLGLSVISDLRTVYHPPYNSCRFIESLIYFFTFLIFIRPTHIIQNIFKLAIQNKILGGSE